METIWWSASQKKYVALSTLHDAHVLRALLKLDRGEYVPGGEPAVGPLSADEEAELREAFDAEFKRRLIGPYAPPPEGTAGE
jgi:hypothetical protein